MSVYDDDVCVRDTDTCLPVSDECLHDPGVPSNGADECFHDTQTRTVAIAGHPGFMSAECVSTTLAFCHGRLRVFPSHGFSNECSHGVGVCI